MQASEPFEQRRTLIGLAIMLCAGLAILPVAGRALAAEPAFAAAYGTLVVASDALAALMLGARAVRDHDSRMGVLAAAYAFAMLLAAGNALALLNASDIGFGEQSGPWMWAFRHWGWGAFVAYFAWQSKPRVPPRPMLLTAVAAALGCVAIAVRLNADLPAAAYAAALLVIMIAVAGLVRRFSRLSVLELGVLVAAVATILEIALVLVSHARFSFGVYSGRLFALLPGIVVVLVLSSERAAPLPGDRDDGGKSEFRELAELVPQIMWIASPEGAIEWYNSAWYTYTGQSREEAAGWGWQGTHHPDDHADVMRIWPAALASGEPYEMEYRLKNAEGHYRWFLSRGRPYRDATGNIVRWFGTNTDIDDQKREAERSQRVAMALQQVFLPDKLPERDDLVFDAAYVPAESDALVGGDWYDAVTLPDGRLLISIGDVGGHGLQAAVAAGRLRQIILSEALNGGDAATILGRADRLLRLQSDVIATALVAFYDPLEARLTFMSAGHPAPVLAVPGSKSRFAQGAHGAPLGTGFMTGAHAAQATSMTVPDGALLVFFTDGVTEIDRDLLGGEARLLEVSDRHVSEASLSAQGMLDDILAGRQAKDDIAMLLMWRSRGGALTRTTASLTRAWTFHSSSARSASDARTSLMDFIRKHAAPGADFFAAELVLGELLANTVEHAPGLVEVRIDWSQARPLVRVRDSGPGLVAIDGTLPSDAMSENGRGLYLIKTLAEDVQIKAAPGFGVEITLRLAVKR